MTPSAKGLAQAPTRWIEPPWKAVLSNKGMLALLWEMFPGHPNLLPAFFEDEPNAKGLSSSFVRKPLLSREGANVEIVRHGNVVAAQQGPVRGRRLYPPGAGAAAEFFRPISGARKLARRSRALRAVDPRGRKSRSRATRRAFCRTRSFEKPAACPFIAPREQRPVCGMPPAKARLGGSNRVRAIEPAPIGIGLEGIGDAHHGFGRAQHQEPVGFDQPWQCARKCPPWCPGRNRSGRCGRR